MSAGKHSGASSSLVTGGRAERHAADPTLSAQLSAAGTTERVAAHEALAAQCRASAPVLKRRSDKRFRSRERYEAGPKERRGEVASLHSWLLPPALTLTLSYALAGGLLGLPSHHWR